MQLKFTMTKFFLIQFLITIVLDGVNSLNNECGQIKSDNNSSFPWNVGIYSENQNHLELICFGSIIQSNAILTAAHCFCDNLGGNLRNNSFYIATGNLQKIINSKTNSNTLHKVNKNNIFLSKHYKGFINLLSSDIAIVKHKLEFNEKPKPVCFDWSNDITDKQSAGKQSVWNKSKVINIDQFYLDSEDCSSVVPKDFATFITADKSCTKTKDIHLGHESEGAGLFFLNPDDNHWYIKGVISMHETTEGKFSTYTAVNQYLNWISNVCASL